MQIRNITGVVKAPEAEVIVINDDDSSDEEDDYDNGDTGMPKLEPGYDSDSDDEDDDDDVSPCATASEVEVEATLPQRLGIRDLRERKKRTHYVPNTSEFTNKNIGTVRNNVGHFQGLGLP